MGACWENTAVTLPDEHPAPWHELFTGRMIKPSETPALPLAEMLADFPCAVLTRH